MCNEALDRNAKERHVFDFVFSFVGGMEVIEKVYLA